MSCLLPPSFVYPVAKKLWLRYCVQSLKIRMKSTGPIQRSFKFELDILPAPGTVQYELRNSNFVVVLLAHVVLHPNNTYTIFCCYVTSFTKQKPHVRLLHCITKSKQENQNILKKGVFYVRKTPVFKTVRIPAYLSLFQTITFPITYN